jgi:hypothetical protein
MNLDLKERPTLQTDKIKMTLIAILLNTATFNMQ